MLTKIHHAVDRRPLGRRDHGRAARPRARAAAARAARAAPARRRPRARARSRCSRAALLGLPRYPVRLLRSLPARAAEPRRDAVRHAARAPRRVAEAADRLRRAVGARRRRRARARRRCKRAADVLQRPRLAAPALRLRPARRSTRSRRSRTRHGVHRQRRRRRDLRRRGAPLADRARRAARTTPLVAQIPVSVRTEAQQGTYGNRIMLMSAPLFTNVVGPGRAPAARPTRRCASMKERHRALPAELLQDANHFIPPAVFARAARADLRLSTASRRGRPTWNLVISNVPGPQFPLYCAGARARGQLPGLGGHRRHGAQHHRDELLRQAWTSGSSPTATRCPTPGA